MEAIQLPQRRLHLKRSDLRDGFRIEWRGAASGMEARDSYRNYQRRQSSLPNTGSARTEGNQGSRRLGGGREGQRLWRGSWTAPRYETRPTVEDLIN